jgi:hypothetical protein
MYLYPISENVSSSAIDGTAREIREQHQRAALYKALASSNLCGRVVNRSLLPRVQALFPGWEVRYFISDYNKRWREFCFSRRRDDQTVERYDLYIANNDAPRLDPEYLLSKAEESTERAHRLESALADFQDALGQYNNLVGYLSALRDRLRPVMYQSGYPNSW